MSPETRKTGKRQLDYQRRHVAMGLCRLCPLPLARGSSTYCEGHRETFRTLRRNAYRLKVGIPLDAPLSRRGRPRVTT